jgi:hypothetical protein
MEKSSPEAEYPRRWCVTGHPITDLSGQTELTVVDAGANLRLCREHGAPVRVETTNSVSHPVLDR